MINFRRMTYDDLFLYNDWFINIDIHVDTTDSCIYDLSMYMYTS